MNTVRVGCVWGWGGHCGRGSTKPELGALGVLITLYSVVHELPEYLRALAIVKLERFSIGESRSLPKLILGDLHGAYANGVRCEADAV